MEEPTAAVLEVVVTGSLGRLEGERIWLSPSAAALVDSFSGLSFITDIWADYVASFDAVTPLVLSPALSVGPLSSFNFAKNYDG